MPDAEPVLPLSSAREPEAPGRLSIPAHTDNWDEYFLCMALTASTKSKDPKCRVGAVIVSEDNVILSTGFNGLARGVHDDDEILRDAAEKLRVICHAEDNAILNAARVGARLQGATIYVTKFPCLACCNSIIQAGIKRIYTHDDRFWDDDPVDGDHTRKVKMLHDAHIKVDAPFHPTFMPKEQIPGPKKKPPARETVPPRIISKN